MKYLKLLLLLLVFCLTGCDVTYNLTITDDEMIESVDFWYDDTKENEKIIDQYLSVKHQAYFNMDTSVTNNYNQKKITDDGKIGMNLEYGYDENNLEKSSLIDKCYYKKSVSNTDDEINIYTDGKVSCMYMDDVKQFDSLTINIKTDLEVIDNNADKVEDNTYTWVINEDNYQNHPIEIRLKKGTGNKFNIWIVIIVLVVLLIIGLLFLYHTYLKNQKRNKI